jgi:putative phage-type endonuclease
MNDTITITSTAIPSCSPKPHKYAQAIRLASTLNLSREDWLALRQRGIGSSDAASAIGVSPYKSALTLWLEKSGRKVPEDISHKEAVIWGSALEPVLANEYRQRTGRKVRRVNAVLQHPHYPFMLANLDRETHCPVHGTGVLEIKTAGYHSAAQWENGIPVAYQCQVLHQLAVTGHAWADIAVLIGGQDFRIYRIERDEAKVAQLIAQEQTFWECVTHNRQPAPDGSDDAANALQWLYPQHSASAVDWSGKQEYNLLFEELLGVRREKDAYEAKESLIKQHLQAALGEAEVGIFANGRVSWKKAKDRVSPDLERLSEEHPDLVAQYAKSVQGSRRFLVQAQALAKTAG